MYSRVTQLEIDTVRIAIDEAVELFRREVVPALQQQEGYEGVLVLTTPEGRGTIISFWASEEAAEASGETGFYPETIARYVTLFRAPPGRERYAVAYSDVPALLRD